MFERFTVFVRMQNVERTPFQDFQVEQVAGSLDKIPDSIKDFEPGDFWGNYVDDEGHHIWNQRLPGGYHLTVDVTNGPVNLHFDAYDPLKGLKETNQHWYWEVRRIGVGKLKVHDPVNQYPDWE